MVRKTLADACSSSRPSAQNRENCSSPTLLKITRGNTRDFTITNPAGATKTKSVGKGGGGHRDALLQRGTTLERTPLAMME